MPAVAASNPKSRPTLHPLHQPASMLRPSAAAGGSRSIFIQTENTPNADALKFLPNHPILPPGLPVPFLEYTSPRATLSPPHPSPLAASLMNVDGVTAVFYGADFITVTKAADANWAHIKPEVFSLITEAVTSGSQIVTAAAAQEGGAPLEEDTLSYNENDTEVVGMIKELLETRIRPAIQEDGGDIEFRGFEGGNVLLKLRGACRTCDSSTVTLKNGIEGMLMHYVSDLLYVSRGIFHVFLSTLRLHVFSCVAMHIRVRVRADMESTANPAPQIEEVKGVVQVLDQEEEIAMQEFARFEEKLKEQKGRGAAAATGGKGSLDTVPG